MTDKFEGVGGSYVADPKTGERSLVERTFDPNQDAAGQTPPATPATAPAENTDQEEA